MKRIAYASIIALMLSTSSATLAADSSDRPAGVAAEDWLPVGERFGIVLRQLDGPVGRDESPASPLSVPSLGTTLLLTPPVGGYFMIKIAGGWTRLVVVEPAKGPADVG